MAAGLENDPSGWLADMSGGNLHVNTPNEDASLLPGDQSLLTSWNVMQGEESLEPS